jgi:predicted  nucleic acid-binding Zn-ribbon protein
MRYTNAPPYSCPDFDKAIEHIEAARAINEKLREDNRKFDYDLDAASERIAHLEQKLETAEQRIESLEYQLEQLDGQHDNLS